MSEHVVRRSELHCPLKADPDLHPRPGNMLIAKCAVPFLANKLLWCSVSLGSSGGSG